jgi:peptidyl-prolyl cis-trans isomerase C
MRLFRSPATVVVAGLAGLLIAQAPAPQAPGQAPAVTATSTATADPLLATVSGEEIHLSDVAGAVQSLPAQYRDMPQATLYPMLLDQLVDQKSLLVLARKEGLDKDPAVRKQIARAEDQALQSALISRAVGPLVTDAAVHARFDKDNAGKPGEQEVHARHILVASEDEALKIIAELKAGGDFAKLAKDHSTDPGGAQGGDLGFFKRGDMVPAFSDAAFAMKPGQVSDKPVHSQFGWHVIQVLEVRQAPATTFEQSRDELRQTMIQEGVQKVLADARAVAEIKRFNPDGTPQRPTDLAEPPPAPGK